MVDKHARVVNMGHTPQSAFSLRISTNLYIKWDGRGKLAHTKKRRAQSAEPGERGRKRKEDRNRER